MLYNIMVGIHIVVCLALIIVVLMQSSKGGGLAGAFGGGGDQTLFGGHETATFLSKATTYLAILFMVLSLTLAFLTSSRQARGGEDSVLRRYQQQDVIPRGESVEEFIGTVTDTTDAAPSDSQ